MNRGKNMNTYENQETFAFLESEETTFEVSRATKSSKRATKMAIDFDVEALPESELTEIVCDDSMGALYSLLPSLARLSEENRWITLIAPPANLDDKLFALYGIDPSRILLIHPKDLEQSTSVMNKALKNGKSGIVVYWSNAVHGRFLAQWRKSVKQGECIGVWINSSTKASCSSSIAITVDVVAANKFVKIKKIKEYGIDLLLNSEIVLPKVNIELLTSNLINRNVARHH